MSFNLIYLSCFGQYRLHEVSQAERSGVEGKAFWFHFFVSSQGDFLLLSGLKLRCLTGLLDEDHDDSGMMKVRLKRS